MDVRKCAQKNANISITSTSFNFPMHHKHTQALTSRWLFWERPTPQALPYTYLGFSAHHWEHNTFMRQRRCCNTPPYFLNIFLKLVANPSLPWTRFRSLISQRIGSRWEIWMHLWTCLDKRFVDMLATRFQEFVQFLKI